MRPSSQPVIDDHVFLLGRPPIGDFLGFVRTSVLDGQSADQGQLTQEWRIANDHVLTLERSEAGLADNPAIQPLPDGLVALAAQVRSDPVFRHAFRLIHTEIALVELDRLVVFQKHINLGFVGSLRADLGSSPTAEAVFNLVLPNRRDHPHVRIMQNAQNVYSLISPSEDFRFLEAELIDPRQVTGFPSTGYTTAFIALAVGYGSNFLNAIQLENRLVLNNGSHRAYALRDLGVSHVPCIIQQLSRREELDLVVTGELQQHPDRYLKAPRPPLLKDYFDPLLRKIVQVPRKERLVRLQFGVEQTDIPAS